MVPCLLTPCDPYGITCSFMCPRLNLPKPRSGRRTKGCSGTTHRSPAPISSTNRRKIISLFASYVPFQQARLSHYGGGKSSSIEVETLLVFPPFFWVQSLLWILHLDPRPPFCSSLCVLFSVRSTFFCSAWVLLHGWMSFVFPAEKCIVHGGKKVADTAPNAALLFFYYMNVHLWCLCNVLCLMWPSFQSAICKTYGSPCRQTGETAACFSSLNAKRGRVQIDFCISTRIATYLGKKFKAQSVNYLSTRGA